MPGTRKIRAGRNGEKDQERRPQSTPLEKWVGTGGIVIRLYMLAPPLECPVRLPTLTEQGHTNSLSLSLTRTQTQTHALSHTHAQYSTQ